MVCTEKGPWNNRTLVGVTSGEVVEVADAEMIFPSQAEGVRRKVVDGTRFVLRGPEGEEKVYFPRKLSSAELYSIEGARISHRRTATSYHEGSGAGYLSVDEFAINISEGPYTGLQLNERVTV